MYTFNAAAVQAVIDGMHSLAAQLGEFARVIDHEPKSPPGAGLSLALWWDQTTAVAAASGCRSVSARVAFRGRAYQSMTFKDEDKLDPHLLGGVHAFLAALAGTFTLGGIAMEVDLLGAYGEPLGAKGGYQLMDSKWYRIADMPVPVIVSDVWTVAP